MLEINPLAETTPDASGKAELLVLDAKAGDVAEPLYRGLGWQEAGRIPRFALDADGIEQDAVIFWKRV